jgi:hypothetical protein
LRAEIRTIKYESIQVHEMQLACFLLTERKSIFE